MTIFLGDKPFSCDICQKKFALSCNLRAHLKTHEAEYQTSPASFALYRRTLELLGVAEAQERLDRIRDDTEDDDEEERLGSESSSPGAAGIVPESNASNHSPGSPHPADEEEEVGPVDEADMAHEEERQRWRQEQEEDGRREEDKEPIAKVVDHDQNIQNHIQRQEDRVLGE